VIGRVTTLMIAQTTLDELNQAYDRLSTTQEQLSSGKVINQPSDNPYGMSMVLRMQGELGSLNNYTNQINDGTAWSQASQTALTNIANVVQRVRELTVQGANGTNTSADLNAQAAEVDQLISSVEQEANTTYDGQYVFAGTANVAPYQAATGDAYQGNTGSAAAVTRLIGPGTSVQVNADLGSVLGSGQNGAGGPDGKLLDVLRTISADMKSGNISALGNADLTNLDTNFNALTELQASVGGITDRLQLASSRIQSLQLNDTQVLSNTQDADMAQTMINYSTEQAAYTAALKAGANIVQQSLLNFLQ
jgi:flagellar hook-associated protein 3 FlgL